LSTPSVRLRRRCRCRRKRRPVRDDLSQRPDTPQFGSHSLPPT
jgi:hypothetical protein